MPVSHGSKAIGYCRFSDPSQDSNQQQSEWIRATAKANGLELVAIHSDDGISGDDRTRPGLASLLLDLQRHQQARTPIAVLLTAATDRFSRGDSIDTFGTLRDMRDAGLRHIVTKERSIDLQAHIDQVLFSLEANYQNHAFLRRHAERALTGMLAMAKEGFWLGKAPIGYRISKAKNEHGEKKKRRSGRLVIHDEEASIVLEIFERYLAGDSTTKLAAWLNTLPNFKPKGKAAGWQCSLVRGILTNRTYAGVRVFGKTRRGKYYGVDVKQNGAIPQTTPTVDNIECAFVERGGLPAIISEEMFYDVQMRLREGRRRGYRAGRTIHPLTGLGKCGHCGKPIHCMTKREGKTMTPVLSCANRSKLGKKFCEDGPAGVTHNLVLAIILKKLEQTFVIDQAAKSMADKAARAFSEASSHVDKQRASITREIAKMEKAIDEAPGKMVYVNPENMQMFQAGIAKVKAELDQLRQRLLLIDQRKNEGYFDPDQFTQFITMVRQSCEIKAGSFPPNFNEVMRRLISGFTLFCTKNKRGKAIVESVEIQLPLYLGACVFGDPILYSGVAVDGTILLRTGTELFAVREK